MNDYKDSGLISIIIPIYNTEDYLKRCINSIQSSTYQNFEVWMIDDGSTDKSREICLDFCKKDPRLHYLRQDNAGVSVARNLGLAQATGEWVIFVDSDDYITSNYLELIAEHAKTDVSLMIFDTNWYGQENARSEEMIAFSELEKMFMIQQAILSQSLVKDRFVSARAPVAKAYKRAFLMEHNLQFPVGIKLGEDELFNIQVYHLMEQALYNPQVVYIVEYREGSATHRFHRNFVEHSLLFFDVLQRILKEHGIYTQLERFYYENVLSGVIAIFRNYIFHKDNQLTDAKRRALFVELFAKEPIKTAMTYNGQLGSFKRRMLLKFASRNCYRLVKLYFGVIDK